MSSYTIGEYVYFNGETVEVRLATSFNAVTGRYETYSIRQGGKITHNVPAEQLSAEAPVITRDVAPTTSLMARLARAVANCEA